MKFANLAGRAAIVTDTVAIDVETASHRRFAADPHAVFARWADFRRWADDLRDRGDRRIVESELGAPSPRPAQVFGIGLNYKAHAAEAGLPVPSTPAVFTKFPTCITGPAAEVILPSSNVDWEVELVVVIGIRACAVAESAAWDYVAGLQTTPTTWQGSTCRSSAALPYSPRPTPEPKSASSCGSPSGCSSPRRRSLPQTVRGEPTGGRNARRRLRARAAFGRASSVTR